ncbi:hypothetical protein PSACC_00296 [Paramicrosporidium saccamoebae]|uniref:Arrestin C-terminal-like domain-containing protein n=1 Tax=Paramicrosporidium saccamoebae TaxID=1246581 RepID=A0A2H9TQ51_9FUNG|nr:hypothetical protein PSACC_00296 [Paramicrosporidium saccamoebae]
MNRPISEYSGKSLVNGVDAEIKISQSHYTAGSAVQGTIILRIRRCVEHSGINIQCYCRVSANWVPDPKKPNSGDNYRPFELRLANTVGKDDTYVPPGVLNVGMMELPFKFVLSSDISQTCAIPICSGRHLAEIAHQITATVIFPNAMDMHVTRDFRVIKLLTPVSTDTYNEIVLNEGMCMAARAMVVKLSVERDVFQAGEDIPVIVEIDRYGFLKSFHRVTLFLERNASACFSGKNWSTVDEVVSHGELLFPKDACGAYTFKIKLPANTPASVVSEMFSCIYQVVLKIEISKSRRVKLLLATKLTVRIGFRCTKASKTPIGASSPAKKDILELSSQVEIPVEPPPHYPRP